MLMTNATAGPSTLFLLPPRPPHPPPRLASTDDLLTRFQLLPAYDKYVRDDDDAQAQPPPPDNGKGKAREQASPAPQTPGEQDGDDDDGQPKGEKKKKNSYKHLIKGVPGKHSMKKDDYLGGIMLVPPKQHIKIVPFDLRTQREAFAVSLEGLKGWNPNTLILESAQAREDRKRRKELKRLAKAHQQQIAANIVTGSPLPTAVGTPRPAVSAGTPRPTVGTPRTAPRPALPPVTTAAGRVGTPMRTGATPTTPHPLSAHPVTAERGVKREREPDVLASVNGHGLPAVMGGGVPQQQAPTTIGASKAGIAGARPRPLKKQKTDHIPIHQQPTPQGV
ncbi:hypothetical protein MIND_00250200 [Mycena indigotica]|uniref:Mediator of RNA polymerase II transcription subunit 19 n=1 Tax=Mycena indigotica TaxID=2126181 RepID=A0A8H6WHD8_9AGAR|nr:uncharacterized protein MIND_00250200 [Mycena indigotica]KAF7312369.1 hypothetical protein MIND_00250200 [Mycena indigotica]